MDHHHPSSTRSTTAKEEKEEDLSHDDKRAKTNASSSSSSATTINHDVDILPPPQPPALHLYSLSDIAHDAVAPYLTMKDLHCMMESSQYLLKAYEGRIKELRLPQEEGEGDDGNEEEEDNDDDNGDGKDEEEEGEDDGDNGDGGEAKLRWLEDKAKEDLSEWLWRTKAPHLRAFVSSYMWIAVAQALCSSGVAPGLQILDLTIYDADSIPLLARAIGRGAWPHLREFRAHVWTDTVTTQMVSSLVEAIGVGARELTILKLAYVGAGPEGATAVSRMLTDGGCPRLEELDLSRSHIGDSGVVELARALEGGASGGTTLRRLDLSICAVTSVGVRQLMESMGRGALPRTECLKLSGNWDIKDDGLVALAGSMSGGSLRFLQELDLSCVGMEQRGAKALFQALQEHKPCPDLKELILNENIDIDDDGVVHLAKAIEAGALQHLQRLCLFRVCLGEEGFKFLVKAIVTKQPNPGCPRLEVLDVGYNYAMGDGSVMYLAEMVKVKGGVQHLREIHLARIGMSIEGARALFRALGEDHACPNLQELSLEEDPGQFENEVRIDVDWDEGVISRNAPRVRQLVEELMPVRGRQRHCSKVKII